MNSVLPSRWTTAFAALSALLPSGQVAVPPSEWKAVIQARRPEIPRRTVHIVLTALAYALRYPKATVLTLFQLYGGYPPSANVAMAAGTALWESGGGMAGLWAGLVPGALAELSATALGNVIEDSLDPLVDTVIEGTVFKLRKPTTTTSSSPSSLSSSPSAGGSADEEPLSHLSVRLVVHTLESLPLLLSRLLSVSLVYPLLVVQTRMQAQVIGGESEFTGLMESLLTIAQSEGFDGLYAGYSQTVLMIAAQELSYALFWEASFWWLTVSEPPRKSRERERQPSLKEPAEESDDDGGIIDGKDRGESSDVRGGSSAELSREEVEASLDSRRRAAALNAVSAASFVFYPLAVLSTRSRARTVALEGGSLPLLHKETGLWEGLVTMWTYEGIYGLWRGYPQAPQRTFP